ncbi:WAT1-related protein At3g28050-like [Malania oleifera]|uniref:WAT1-related protein At3g28050-like n=1 Tax=Malania oleifera TaxID=397392 RepID=UPI0025AE48B8|nr:WAT1-related protein At3g28050-like [Malania oleifera]
MEGVQGRRWWGRQCWGSGDVLPLTGMVGMQCITVGLSTLFKAATSRGMSYYVYTVYISAIALLLLLPSPFFSHRNRGLPSLNFSVLCKMGLLGLVGYTSQIMGYKGINYSSPTLSSAISNLLPAFTFIFALLFRMEKVDLSRPSSQAKVLGTIVSIAGASVVTFYKGPPIIVAPSQPSSSGLLHLQHLNSSSSSQSNWLLGSLFLTAEFLLIPLCYIIQAQVMKEYPSELTVVFFYNLEATVLGGIVALIAEENWSAWRVGPNISLLSILCSGIVGSFMNNVVHTWALRLKGPVYVAMFKPLNIVIAAAMGVIFLGDLLHLGCVIGATMIAVGFYAVMWGKAEEEMSHEGCEVGSLRPQMHTQKTPLLPKSQEK